jgi:hypothetical protein
MGPSLCVMKAGYRLWDCTVPAVRRIADDNGWCLQKCFSCISSPSLDELAGPGPIRGSGLSKIPYPVRNNSPRDR